MEFIEIFHKNLKKEVASASGSISINGYDVLIILSIISMLAGYSLWK